MARTSVSISSFGYIGGTGGVQIRGSGTCINRKCKITGGNIVREQPGRLFYIEGLLCSYSVIEGVIKEDRLDGTIQSNSSVETTT